MFKSFFYDNWIIITVLIVYFIINTIFLIKEGKKNKRLNDVVDNVSNNLLVLFKKDFEEGSVYLEYVKLFRKKVVCILMMINSNDDIAEIESEFNFIRVRFESLKRSGVDSFLIDIETEIFSSLLIYYEGYKNKDNCCILSYKLHLLGCKLDLFPIRTNNS